MKTIKYVVETIKEIKNSWGCNMIDKWDEEYLSMTL